MFLSRMNVINEKVNGAFKTTGIKLRPNASPGTWMILFLPVAILSSVFKHPTEVSLVYKKTALLGVGLLFSSIVLVTRCYKRCDLTKIGLLNLLTGTGIATVSYVTFRTNFAFSLLAGLLSGIIYNKLLISMLLKLPNAFTLGEAALVAQGMILFIYSALLNVSLSIKTTPHKILDVATLIIQIGLLGIASLYLIVYLFPWFRRKLPFYALFIFVIVALILFPINVLLKQDPILWIFGMFVRDVNTLKIITYWVICTCACILAVNRQISVAKNATTSVRKIFHVLTVAVYFPGLMYECSLLYTASGVILGIILTLELMRLINIPPIGRTLHEGFLIFCDEKDSGGLALTPVYLLVGCSLPLWLHPSGCDVTDSAGFNILAMSSGLLTIGIGDSSASIIGSLIGKHKWPGSKKSIEGSLSCAISQVIAVFILVYCGIIFHGHEQIIKSFIAIMVTTIIEATTSQVDNLILPLIMYTILV